MKNPSGCGRRALRFGIVALLLALAAGGSWLWAGVFRPVTHDHAGQIISIEPGISTYAIIKKLDEAGIVRSFMAVRIYLRLTGHGSRLKAGDYQFTSPISPRDAIAMMERGEVYVQRVTIPEGLNRFEIAELLSARTGKAQPAEFLTIMSDPSRVANLAPGAGNLEGYLFPDTYDYNSKTSPRDLIMKMVARFEEVFTDDQVEMARKRGLTVHEAVTLASIVEEEARVPDERPTIASVFYNRLKIGMPLGADPTFIYAAILAGDYDGNPNNPRHRRRDSPYNTYVRSGLPPGPIASPGLSSLEAVLEPAGTDFLYFVVSGTEGRHKFSRTSREHEAAVEEYRRLQREQRLRSGG